MTIENLQNKMVAVLGYGLEGKAVTNYLLKHGIKPVLFDHRPWHNWSMEEQEQIKKLELNFIFGPESFKELAGFDYIFRSPGIKLGLLNKKIIGKAEITSQTKYFFDNCPAKIIGVTGTKGKGTTASLIYELLHKGEISCFLTGNIGKIQPLEFLDTLTTNDNVVFELSSFQLQDLKKSPHIGVVLMVTSEHLDYHKDQEEYHEAKNAICKFQTTDDYTIINHDYEVSKNIGKLGSGKKLYFSRSKKNLNCFVENNQIILQKSNVTIPVEELKLLGEHNLENISAALLVAEIHNIDQETILNTVVNFKGLEHRLEFVKEVKGIKFYNDSFSTTPETTIAAIHSFKQPEILILGGSSKNSNFAILIEQIHKAPNIKSIILVGDEGIKLEKMLEDSGIRLFTGAKSMSEIFSQLKTITARGDVVLLSPACASFDMFKNYEDRGNQFKEFVNKW